MTHRDEEFLRDEAAYQAADPTAPDPVGEARDVAPSWDMLRREVAALRAENERINKDRDDWRKGYALIASALGIKDTLSAVALAEVALNLRAALEQARELSYASRWADLICALEAALTDQA